MGEQKERETLGSRLGFLLLSAGCAIGLGNVWRFPYITGKYGGAAFVLIYLVFLVILGLPVMVCEFAVGRASRKSMAEAFKTLEPEGTKWHIYGGFAVAGNYLLMMFYTVVSGWFLKYFFQMIGGKFVGLSGDEIVNVFVGETVGSPSTLLIWMVVVIVIGFGTCFLGLQKGVERITKIMMSALMVIMIGLAIYVAFLPGAGDRRAVRRAVFHQGGGRLRPGGRGPRGGAHHHALRGHEETSEGREARASREAHHQHRGGGRRASGAGQGKRPHTAGGPRGALQPRHHRHPESSEGAHLHRGAQALALQRARD